MRLKLLPLIAATIFFLGCSIYLIKAPIESGNDSWRVVIELLKVGPNQYSTPVIVDKYFPLTDKPNTNKNAYDEVESRVMNSNKIIEYSPKDENYNLLWMKLNIRNISSKGRYFAFSRLILESNDYRTFPDFITSYVPFYCGETIGMIKPKEKVTRWLVYLFPKGLNPRRIIYNYQSQHEEPENIIIDFK